MNILNRRQEKKLVNAVDQKEVDTINEINSSERFKEDKVLAYLNQIVTGSVIKDDALYLEALDLTIEVQVPYVNGAVAQIVFVLKHKLFQEDLRETVAGAGATFDSAMIQGVSNFTKTTLSVVTKALEKKAHEKLEVKVGDKINLFNCYASEVLVQGTRQAGEEADLWKILKEDVKLRLGHKRAYVLKVYVSKSTNGIYCECMVNGLAYPNLARKLEKVAESWQIEKEMYAEKQVFVLMQADETYRPYTLSRKEVESQTLNTLLLLRACQSQEEYIQLYHKIYEACGLASLASELYNFIPEIFTEIIFSDVHYSDEVVLAKGEERIGLYRHQLTSYDWIYSVVERTIRAGYFAKPQVDCIMRCSTSFKSLCEAVSKGSKMADLVMMGIGFAVPDTYEIL